MRTRAIQPKMPVTAYQTFQILAPIESHWRQATCAEAGCSAHQKGWRTTVDENTDLGFRQAAFIRADKSRRHTEQHMPSGLTQFDFEPGQKCFAAADHRTPLERPARFIERSGDFRGNPDGQRRELTDADWVDSFANRLINIADEIKKG